jgi:hypothetical protein
MKENEVRSLTTSAGTAFAMLTPQAGGPAPPNDFENYGFMRAPRCDPAPQPGWRVDWTIEDRHGLARHVPCTSAGRIACQPASGDHYDRP